MAHVNEQPDPAPRTDAVGSAAMFAEHEPTRIDQPVIERAARVIRVLGHPLRLRLLEAMEPGERNVTELVVETGATQATVSQQLATLRAEGVVGARRDGPRVFYRITEPKVSSILACIRACDLPELGEPVQLSLVEPDSTR
jgi:DNA-binding transcriptional ArsR family regulator